MEGVMAFLKYTPGTVVHFRGIHRRWLPIATVRPYLRGGAGHLLL